MGGTNRLLGCSAAICALALQLGACAALTDNSAAPSSFFTAAQASRGERRFDQLCADCHRTVEITRSWGSGSVHQTAGDLFTVMSMTMPDSNPGGLSADQYADILAFLLRMNNYPEGENELPADPAVLANVPIPAP